MTAGAQAPGGGGAEGVPTSAAALPVSVAMPNFPPLPIEVGSEPTEQLALDTGHLVLDPGHLALGPGQLALGLGHLALDPGQLALDATAAAAVPAAAPAPELRAPTSEFRAPSPWPERGVGPSLAVRPVTSSGELNEQAESVPAPGMQVAASTSGPVGTDREAVAAAANGPSGTDRERRLQLEVERLRSHIMTREEAFTHEVLQQDAQLHHAVSCESVESVVL